MPRNQSLLTATETATGVLHWMNVEPVTEAAQTPLRMQTKIVLVFVLVTVPRTVGGYATDLVSKTNVVRVYTTTMIAVVGTHILLV